MSQTSIAEVLACLDPQLWLVTAQDGTRRGGYIATSVSNLSIVPGMHRLLISVAHAHFTHGLIAASGAFALHVLGEDQLDWVWHFGLQSGRDRDKLAGLACRAGMGGSPLLPGVAGWLDCRVEAKLDIGERSLFVGEVVDGKLETDRPPLHWQRVRTADGAPICLEHVYLPATLLPGLIEHQPASLYDELRRRGL